MPTMQLAGVVFVLVAVSLASSAKPKIDQFIPVCSRSDPNLNECVRKSGQLFFPTLAKGIREYGFPPIDPLKVPFLGLSQSDGPVGLKLNISDTTHVGIRDTQISGVNIDTKTNHWQVDLFFPQYSITGICDLGGRILLLPISGHGPCNLTSVDMTLILTIDGKPEVKNGKTYFKESKVQIKAKFSKGSFVLEGLFGGNKELGATMNRFLNENAVDVLNEMKNTLETVWAELFAGLLGRIFENVPYDELIKP